MKIAFRISKMGYGGAERVFISIAKFIKIHYQVDVHFVVDSVGQGETESLVIEQGFKLIDLSCSRTLKSIFPLKEYIGRENPDLIISAYTDTNFAAILSTMLAKSHCKVIVSEHASLKEHWQNFSFIRRLVLNGYVKFGYRFADHVLAVSGGIRNQLIRMGLSKVKVSYIYNPVRFKSNMIKPTSKEHVTLIAVGRISKQKDYLTLLKAFNLIVKTYKQKANLLIVGGIHEVSEKKELDMYIEYNGLSKQVEFVGFTNKIETYFKVADLFVLSSAWEGFGNVIVEALAFGLPVVSTDCNHGPAEILEQGKYGKLVQVGNFVQMAEAINDILIKNPFPKSNQMKRARDFSETIISNKYYELFKKVIFEG